MTSAANQLRDEVERRYAVAARAVLEGGAGCGCGSGSCCSDEASQSFGESGYDTEQRAELPLGATLASLGCGNPTAVADLREGEVVLDLGSGGGIDVILSAKRVGPAGVAYGLDMTDEMLALARQNATEAGVKNVHFLKGVIEEIPLPADSVDVVISNCVINLSTDKAAVLTEMHRVLKPGGRLGVSDVVADDRLTPEERAERGSFVGCIAGALSRGEYEAGLEAAGFEQVSVEFTHEVADGMHGAIVRAVKLVSRTAEDDAKRAAAPPGSRGNRNVRARLRRLRRRDGRCEDAPARTCRGRDHVWSRDHVRDLRRRPHQRRSFQRGCDVRVRTDPPLPMVARGPLLGRAVRRRALAAAALLRATLGDVAHVGATLPSGSQAQSFVWELVMSAFLMFVILAVATDTRAVGEAAAIAIGGTIGLDAMFGGPISGASMNPMRSLGPALVGGELHALWIYLTAPVIGTAVGGLAYQFVRGEQPS